MRVTRTVGKEEREDEKPKVEFESGRLLDVVPPQLSEINLG